MIIDFWSDINEVERAPSESIQCDVLAYLEEIKRLQAIEAERDRYKEAVDFCISAFQGNEMFIKAEQVKLMIKGVNDHE